MKAKFKQWDIIETKALGALQVGVCGQGQIIAEPIINKDCVKYRVNFNDEPDIKTVEEKYLFLVKRSFFSFGIGLGLGSYLSKRDKRKTNQYG